MSAYDYTVKSVLPKEVHGVCYMKNHHYLELTDAKGRKIKLNATGIVQYLCKSCHFTCFTPSNHGDLLCPNCKQAVMDPKWTRTQLSFIPEEPSDFRGGFSPQADTAVDKVEAGDNDKDGGS